MLLDTIKRHDQNQMIKLVCIEALRSNGKPVPQQIHTVPALMLLPSKEVMYGKKAFDYLLLPGSGKLLTAKPAVVKSVTPGDATPGEPLAFALGMETSSTFSLVDGGDPTGSDRNYVWTHIGDMQEQPSAMVQNVAMLEETRGKKELPDLDMLRQQRELDLHGENHLKESALPPPTATRV